MNIADLPEEKAKQVKDLILQQRFERNLKQRFGFIVSLFSKIWKELNRQGRRLVQKVYSIEQRYRKMQKSAVATPDTEVIRKLMDEADALVDKEEYFEAEKKYIEILSQFPKHVKAYEALGNLYLLDRKLDQARETFAFALKLKSDDASVHAAMGELETKEGNKNEALVEFAKAIEIRPNNPRYLDFFIEAAIEAKNAAEAQRGLNKLKEVNPENKKLAEFEERITELGK
jgi:tetratricopeptide (TPR) repeat protein